MFRLLQTSILGAFIALFCCLAGSVHAQQYWLEPEGFRHVNAGEVGVRFYYGNKAHGAERPLILPKSDFFIHQPPHAEEEDLLANAKDSLIPATKVKVTGVGTHVVTYQSKPFIIRTPGKAFDRFLKDEGLNGALFHRKTLGLQDSSARELFMRCAKTYIQLGDTASESFQRFQGLQLELIPAQNPFLLHSGDTLLCQVLYQDKPLPGVKITGAVRTTDGVASTSIVSDANGEVGFILADGVWVISTYYLLPNDDPKVADWRSYNSTLSFDIISE